MFYIFMSKMEATYIIVPLTQMQKIQAHNDSTKHLKTILKTITILSNLLYEYLFFISNLNIKKIDK